MIPRHLLCSAFISSLLVSGASAAVTFVPSFTAQAMADLSPADQDKFTDGLDFWSSIITGHRDGVNRTYTLTIDTFNEGVSPQNTITLGSAGPTEGVFSNVVPGALTSDGKFILATKGIASFNVNPAAGTLSALVIRHEIGHAIGIGTLWEDNEVYNDGVAANSNRTATVGSPGQYSGAFALAAYKLEYDPAATFVPVELDGGGGTANGHWNEVADNPNSENTPGFDINPGDGQAAPVVLFGPNAGLSRDDELMTGFLSGTAYLSNTTIQSLVDLGFTVSTPVPEPSVLAFAGLAILCGFRRRR